ncbi:ADP-dependent NAD(P)H-hydrate dehydratase [Nocardiopsis synnemataformans]|uniref:ADP-dependent NAD(P)H-hydrate dehydratase n=1 Tax=Nocardiopsis synnemataformans TaxID=61305 RepID=UPI003EB8BFBE
MRAQHIDRGWAYTVARQHLHPGEIKGDGGHVFVIGGSQAYGSSPYLAALGALRAGTHSARVLAPHVPAAATIGLQVHLQRAAGVELDGSDVAALVRATTALHTRMQHTGAHGHLVWLIGPGLGGNPRASVVVDALARVRTAAPVQVVIDGNLGEGVTGRDRLCALAPEVVLLNRAEAIALTGHRAGPRARPSLEQLVALADDLNAVVVAKGDPDQIVGACGEHWQVHDGHPSLAKHSTGDVLAGLVAGLVAHTVPASEAAALGCHLLGRAGEQLTAHTGPGWLPHELVDALAGPVRDLWSPQATDPLTQMRMS